MHVYVDSHTHHVQWQADLFTSGLSVDSEKVERGPSHFGSDELVDRSKARWHLEYACTKNCCHVLRATPQKIWGENVRGSA